MEGEALSVRNGWGVVCIITLPIGSVFFLFTCCLDDFLGDISEPLLFLESFWPQGE